MLHIVYRSYGGENAKGRPNYYSKLLSLKSFIRSFQQLKPGVAEIIFLNDGPIPEDRLRLMERSGEVLACSNLGSTGSLRGALAIPIQRRWPHNDSIWLSEDDYLYQLRALNDLVAAAESFPDASYFGLYAAIGSRLPNGSLSDDRIPREWQGSEATLVNGHPWRLALSTTHTFGARVEALVADRLMIEYAAWSGGSSDHTMCLMYQGFRPYPISSLIDSLIRQKGDKKLMPRVGVFCARMSLNLYQVLRSIKRSNRRRLVAADPALVTHLETSYMADGTDWQSLAVTTQQWTPA